MGISVKSRASLRLTGRSRLSSSEVIKALTQSAEVIKGNPLTGLRCHILTDNVTSTSAEFVVSQKMLWESPQCAWSAAATEADGITKIRVGGLEDYKTSQEVLLGFIPLSPKAINGMSLYKDFLEVARRTIIERDPTATLSIDQEFA